MDFYFDKSYFSTPFYLLCKDDGTTEQTTSPPEGALLIGSEESETIAALYGFRIPRFPSLKYRRFFFKKTDSVPWNLVMPKHAYGKEVQETVEDMRQKFGGLDLSYYNKCFVPQNRIFDALEPAKINSDLFDDLMREHGPDDNLKTFDPDRDDLVPVPKYTRTGTVTGRLKVESGPMILNIKSDYRKILTSRFSGGSIWQLDYTSLEPRVLLAINGAEDIPEDVYQAVIDDFGLTDIPRAAIKTSVISRMYGAGDDAIERQLKDLVDYPADLLKLVDEYFGIDELRQKLSSEFSISDGSHVTSFYGRHIQCGSAPLYVLLNYYIQSTAVDVCLFGFGQVVDKLREAEILDKVVPLYILHDALFLDVHPDLEYLLPKICKVGSMDIPRFENTNFWLQATKEV